MSGRIFQNVVLQFKETTDRTIGVIDSEGTVIACSELRDHGGQDLQGHARLGIPL